MYPHDKDGLLRKLSVKLLFKPFYRSGLSANQITVLSFCTLGLGSVTLFFLGEEVLGLLVSFLMAMMDYIDGEIARARGASSKLGEYLDTSLDWLYLMLLLGAIGFSSQTLPLAYLALVSVTWGNWVEFNGGAECKLPLPLTTGFIIPISVLAGHSGAGIACIAGIQTIRTIILYRRSVTCHT